MSGTRRALRALALLVVFTAVSGALDDNTLVADAGRNMALNLPVESVKLRGNGGYGPDLLGDGFEYRWEQAGGPRVQASGANTQTMVLFPSEPGRYVFRLTVTDPENDNTAQDVVEVVVTGESGAPEVDAGRDVTVVLPTKSVQLVAQANDPNGPLAYLWKFEKGPGLVGLAGKESRTLQVMFVNPVEGIYEFSFTATDRTGLASTDTVNVVLQQSNRPPTIEPPAPVKITWPTANVDLTVQASDEDGRVASYSWAQVSGPAPASVGNPRGATASIVLPRTGTYVFNVTVTDNGGASSQQSFVVLCGQPPAIALEPDVYVTWPKDSVQLAAKVNSPPENPVASYLWRVESGPSVVGLGGKFGPVLDVFKLVRGTYEFSLTATDASGQSTVARTTVRVVDQMVPPKVSAGPDIDLAFPNDAIVLHARASDADGRVARYEWAIEAGPAGKVKIAGRETPNLNVANMAAGTYLFSVTVWDDMALSAQAQVVVRVRDERGEAAPLQRRGAPSDGEPRTGPSSTVLAVVICVVLALAAVVCVALCLWERRRRAMLEQRGKPAMTMAVGRAGGPRPASSASGAVPSSKEASSYKPFRFFEEGL